MLNRKPRTTLALVALALAGTAFAGNVLAEAQVEGRIEAYLVATDPDGAEVVRPAAVAEPGELMEYRLTFVNNGDAAVGGLQIVDPVPENTTFVGGSASTDVSASFEVSIDGGRSFEREPVTRVETQADGSQKEVVVPPSRYTHLRWAVDETLAGDGGEQRYVYRVTVD